MSSFNSASNEENIINKYNDIINTINNINEPYKQLVDICRDLKNEQDELQSMISDHFQNDPINNIYPLAQFNIGGIGGDGSIFKLNRLNKQLDAVKSSINDLLLFKYISPKSK